MLWIKQYLGWIPVAIGWVLFGTNAAFNWIGRSTVVDDAEYAAGVIEKIVDWFIGLPTVFTGLLALSLTLGYWIWLFGLPALSEKGGDKITSKTSPKSTPEIKPGFQKTALQSVQLSFEKTDAPNQDGMAEPWRRVCAGIVLRNVNPSYPAALKMRVYALDPNGWRFADETSFDGELAVEEWVDHYPVELHMRMNKTPRLRYERQPGQMVELDEGQELQIVVELYSKEGQHAAHTFCVRTPREGHERFVAKLLET